MDNFPRPNMSCASSEISSTSTSTDATSKTLLFGEIPSLTDGQSSFPSSSVCNLVLSGSQKFLQLWLNENCRDTLLQSVDKSTLPALRLVCHHFASVTSPFLFHDISINFKVSSFTKPGRIATLHRIGRHVRNLTFRTPATSEAFLPPLLNPLTGEQLSFTYVPQLHPSSPKYGSADVDDLLIAQYPPLFHAATNIPSFIRALSALPNLSHVSIEEPYSPPTFSSSAGPLSRYRKSSVDYTLSSLRIALEHAPLPFLHSLSIINLHPLALRALAPVLSPASTPSSARRWTQIRSLSLQIPLAAPALPKQEELLLGAIQAYIRAFAHGLERLHFAWLGDAPGQSPLFGISEPVIWTPALGSDYSFPSYSTSSGHCNASFPPPTPPKDSRYNDQHAHKLKRAHTTASSNSRKKKPAKFTNLKFLDLQNCTLNAEHLSAFITRHRKTLVEFKFEEVKLRGGDWDDMLEPVRVLQRLERSQAKKQRIKAEELERRARQLRVETRVETSNEETEMDVPCVFVTPTQETKRSHHQTRWEEVLQDDLVVEETLEPQPQSQNIPTDNNTGGIFKKLFGSSKPMNHSLSHTPYSSHPIRHERKMSDHLKRVLHGTLFPWR